MVSDPASGFDAKLQFPYNSSKLAHCNAATWTVFISNTTAWYTEQVYDNYVMNLSAKVIFYGFTLPIAPIEVNTVT